MPQIWFKLDDHSKLNFLIISKTYSLYIWMLIYNQYYFESDSDIQDADVKAIFSQLIEQ